MQATGIPYRKSGYMIGPGRTDRLFDGQTGVIWKVFAGLILHFGIGLASMESLFNEHNFE